MALIRLAIRPGINKETTQYGSEGGWYDGNNIRFRGGMPQKIGGYQNASPTSTFAGIARAMQVWNDLNGYTNVALGTHLKLYLWRGGTFSDITPVGSSGTLANPFTTTNGSALVKVTHAAHGRAVGDYVIFSGAAAVGGITISGEYAVTSIVDANNYNITHSAVATSGAGPGGGAAVAYSYLLSIGTADALSGLGYGAGPYGQTRQDIGLGPGYGMPALASGVQLDPRIWTMDNWGEDLIAAPRGGAMYYWDNSTGATTRAAIVATAPSAQEFVLVSYPDRHAVSLGAEQGGTQDKMLVRWSNTEDYTTWTATATNTAGSQRLVGGSKIIGGLQSRGQTLIWTDTHLHGMQYVGPPFVFGFQVLGAGCGLIGPNAAVDYQGVVAWMGSRQFFTFDGAVRELPCTLHRHVFDNINTNQLLKVWAGVNPLYSEIIFFYPSAHSTEIDSFVAVDMTTGLWSLGDIVRTAYRGGTILGYPLAAGTDGKIYYHEVGDDADGAALSAHVESAYMDLGEGDELMFLDRVIPDTDLTGSVALTVKTKRYPNADEIDKGPYQITTATERVDLRARGRQIAFKIASANLGDKWRLGMFRANVQPDGKR